MMRPGELVTDWMQPDALQSFLELGDLVEFRRVVGNIKRHIYTVIVNLNSYLPLLLLPCLVMVCQYYPANESRCYCCFQTYLLQKSADLERFSDLLVVCWIFCLLLLTVGLPFCNSSVASKKAKPKIIAFLYGWSSTF